MSRRPGQSGHIELSGKWWVVRWWQDVPGQDKRAHKRARICPVSGPGKLSKSERQRRARAIIAASGADTDLQFNKVVKHAGVVTFREQSAVWIQNLKTRKQDPVAFSTLEHWETFLRLRLNPQIGDLPLSEINNAVLKGVVAKLCAEELATQTVHHYAKVVKMVVASAVDEEGDAIYPRKWNRKFIDIPSIDKSKQNRPSFTSRIMTGLAAWSSKRERMLFILLGASGPRISEALGLEIDKHISQDCLTITIAQKVREGKVENWLKTKNSARKIDLHPRIGAMLKDFIGDRKTGFLFCSRKGKPLAGSAVYYHLHSALKELGFINPMTGTHSAGFHAFRRFRNTFLRNRANCPPGLRKYWLGWGGDEGIGDHNGPGEDDPMGDLYDAIGEDEALRREWAERCGFGFELPSVVPVVPTIDGETE